MHDLLNPNYIVYTQCAHHQSAKKLQKKVEYREETKEDSVYKRCQEITKLKIDNNSTELHNFASLRIRTESRTSTIDYFLTMFPS